MRTKTALIPMLSLVLTILFALGAYMVVAASSLDAGSLLCGASQFCTTSSLP